MTSAREGKAAAPLPPPGAAAAASAAAGERHRNPLDQLPPPANSNKPLTPFGIEDILSKPSGRRAAAARLLLLDKAAPGPPTAAPPASPLCALEELATKTFRGLEVNVLEAAEGREPVGAFGPRQPAKKRRKSRTAFTNHQIYELEKRFLYQKYLSPADRDHIAAHLGLSNAQVITWFQNRRAKLKRDLEEMKADVESLKKLPPAALEKLASMPELEPDPPPPRARSGSLPRGSPPSSPGAAAALRAKDPFSDGEDQEEDDCEDEEEIDVGD
ncbi:transcription factor LBX2 [Sphaerodactylus townsendi]|uniref:transcription factor LBX2 n=1 Tax=Sphaerodactylus townsendi TaxID=933632 RepID=UPI002025E1E2|nr:transcription factor LBX2 [Sphaerodactylus townsendi]